MAKRTSLTELVEAHTGRSGGTCAIVKVRAQLDAETAAELDALMADEAVQGSAIARALESLGFQIKRDSLQRHRRGDCRCG